MDEVHTLFETGGTIQDITRGFAAEWFERFQNEVLLRAEAEGLRLRDYACTFLGAVVGPESAALVQIGDGAIVYSLLGEEDYLCMFWPQKGEYENVTYFATDPSIQDHFEHLLVDWRIDELALITDGIQRLALEFQVRSPFARFFRPVFAPVRASAGGHSEALSQALATYLNSPLVNERTDDDKTLILATRRTADTPAPLLGDTDEGL